jgi:uncharacterized protein
VAVDDTAVGGDEDDFVHRVLSNCVIRTVLERAPSLGCGDWWLTGGAVGQTVWNVLDGRVPGAGIDDYDLFYFDPADLSYEAEDVVVRRAGALFADVNAEVEVRNQARVHLWYEDHFGGKAVPFRHCRDAIDHFVSTTCCFGLTADGTGRLSVYAPHGFDDLNSMTVRPNPRRPVRDVYERKSARWVAEWPRLIVEPWPSSGP